jgi:hypothetical protein
LIDAICASGAYQRPQSSLCSIFTPELNALRLFGTIARRIQRAASAKFLGTLLPAA